MYLENGFLIKVGNGQRKAGRITGTFDEIHANKPHNAVDIGAMTAGKPGRPLYGRWKLV